MARARATAPVARGAPGEPRRWAAADAPNVTVTALKPHGNPLAAGRPGEPLTGREVTVRLRETDGKVSLLQLRLGTPGGIEAAWRTDILEESEGSRLSVTGGAAFVGIGPFETVTLVLRVGAGDAPVPGAAPATAPPPSS